MKENYVFDLWENIRQRILNEVANLPEHKRDMVPRGFSNNIHWQIGHVLTATDNLVFQFAGKESRMIPESYCAFFDNGTKPSDWPEQPPDWETLVSQLREQLKEFRKTFHGKFSEPGTADNFLRAVVGSIAHESMHAGMISAMVKAD